MRTRCRDSGVASRRAAAQRERTSSRRSRTRSRANSWVGPPGAAGTFSRRSRRVARRTFVDVRATGVRRERPATWIGLAIRGRILHDAREERRMKIALAVIATVLQTLAVCNAYAHGDHKPKHGGIMGRGDDEISVELVMEKGTAILYVEDETGTPLATEKVKGTLSVASPGRPAQEGKLIP